MKALLKKIKRLDPILKLREKELDSEKIKLAQIKERKRIVSMKMKEKQREYLAGIEHLNRLRNSTGRENLPAMESALDTVKMKWNDLFLKIQALEKEEAEQLTLILEAQIRSKSIENLQSKNKEHLAHEESVQEQKLLDDYTLLKKQKSDI